jgi:hypothetical protein
LSLADSGGLHIEGERSRCHIDAAATPRLSTETCAPAPRISADKGLALPAAAARHAGCAGRRNCNVNLDDLDRDRPDLNCEPLQAPGTARNQHKPTPKWNWSTTERETHDRHA